MRWKRQVFTPSAGAVARPSPWQVMVFAYLPAVVAAYILWGEFRGAGSPVPDFFTLFRAGHDIVRGIPPYPPADPDVLLRVERTVYPPPLAFAVLPFTLLPYTVAAALFSVVLVAAGVLLLRVLGVRDWRCIGVFFLWPSMATTLAVGAPGLLLALGAAVAWRWRDRDRVVISVLAFVIASKLFLWPMLIWLFATGRRAVAVATAAASAALTFGLWRAIGFSGFRAYPELVHTLSSVFAPTSYSPTALEIALGWSSGTRTVAGALLVLVAAAGVVVAGRGSCGDRNAFVLALAASLLLTPIVWLHYAVFLAIPIALTRKTLGPAWFAPLVLWATPTYASHGETWRIALVLAVIAGAAAYGVRGARREAERPPAVTPAVTQVCP